MCLGTTSPTPTFGKKTRANSPSARSLSVGGRFFSYSPCASVYAAETMPNRMRASPPTAWPRASCTITGEVWTRRVLLAGQSQVSHNRPVHRASPWRFKEQFSASSVPCLVACRELLSEPFLASFMRQRRWKKELPPSAKQVTGQLRRPQRREHARLTPSAESIRPCSSSTQQCSCCGVGMTWRDRIPLRFM